LVSLTFYFQSLQVSAHGEQLVISKLKEVQLPIKQALLD
jgi:hypothetical protein